MDKHILAILIPLFAVIGVTVLSGVRMLIKHQERMAKLGNGKAAGDPELEARIARVEQVIESMSVEIERNGEAQRYLTKVLAKHLPAEAQEKLEK